MDDSECGISSSVPSTTLLTRKTVVKIGGDLHHECCKLINEKEKKKYLSFIKGAILCLPMSEKNGNPSKISINLQISATIFLITLSISR